MQFAKEVEDVYFDNFEFSKTNVLKIFDRRANQVKPDGNC